MNSILIALLAALALLASADYLVLKGQKVYYFNLFTGDYRSFTQFPTELRIVSPLLTINDEVAVLGETSDGFIVPTLHAQGGRAWWPFKPLMEYETVPSDVICDDKIFGMLLASGKDSGSNHSYMIQYFNYDTGVLTNIVENPGFQLKGVGFLPKSLRILTLHRDGLGDSFAGYDLLTGKRILNTAITGYFPAPSAIVPVNDTLLFYVVAMRLSTGETPYYLYLAYDADTNQAGGFNRRYMDLGVDASTMNVTRAIYDRTRGELAVLYKSLIGSQFIFYNLTNTSMVRKVANLPTFDSFVICEGC